MSDDFKGIGPTDEVGRSLPVAPEATAAPRTSSLSRRNMVIGAAWTLPVVSLAVAAPAMAASGFRPGALEGFVQLEWSCNNSRVTLAVNGVGDYSTRGIWVKPAPGAPQSTAPTNAKIIFYFKTSNNANVSNVNFVNESQNAAWTNLVPAPGETQIAGYSAYRTQYTGGWTFRGNGNDRRWEANSDPKFTANPFYAGSCVSVSAYATRTVTFAGDTITFRRGPVTLGN